MSADVIKFSLPVKTEVSSTQKVQGKVTLTLMVSKHTAKLLLVNTSVRKEVEL